MGEFLEIAKVMVQPAMKLLDMCGNAIGTMYQPRHMRKMTDAEVYRIKQLGNAISETDSLPIAYDNGEISMSTFNFEDFAKRAELRANYQMLREQNNIESVVGMAYQELLDAPEVPSDPVDEDWTTRFFNIVKDVNNEEMQHLWSKILAGEVRKSGTFSLRTLDTIRNISKTEAEVFQKICSCVLYCDAEGFVPQKLSLLEKQGVSYKDLVLLCEAGLLNLNHITYALDFEENVRFWLNYTCKKFLIRIVGNTDKAFRFSYGIYKLTKAGAELYSIIDSAPQKEYVLEVTKEIGRCFYNKAEISLHNLISCNNGEIEYEKKPLFEQKKNEAK